MTVREISPAGGLLSMLARTLATRHKKPGRVLELPKVELVQPGVTLEPAHLKDYSALCGFKASQGVPLTYPQLLTFVLVMDYLSSPECPWPAMGTVHLANTIEQLHSLHAGDSLQVEMSTGELFAHEKGQGYTLKLRILRGDVLVWRATQSLLRLGVKEISGEPYQSQLTTEQALSCQTVFNAPAATGRRYATVSGDRNPIHLSALSAKLFGFRRAIAHGLWTQARALSFLLPTTPLARADVSVEFKTPLFLPGRASLWSYRASGSALFEVRDGAGQRPHLRGQLTY